MLSEETAIGKNPVQCVRVMATLANEGEGYFDFELHQERMLKDGRERNQDADLVALSASAASRSARMDAIIVCSESGNTSRLVSEYRPHVPVYGVSTNAQALSRMALYWGVNPLPMKLSGSSDEERERAFQYVAAKFFDEHPEKNEFGAILVNGPKPGEAYSPSRFEIRRSKRN